MNRYARQMLLPQVGAAGQARLEAARFRVTRDAAGAVARAYLERAGARDFEEVEDPAAAPGALEFRSTAARDFAAGARAALLQIRQVLEQGR